MTSRNLTPPHMRCDDTLTCPSVHQLEDGRLLIVGSDPVDEAAGDILANAYVGMVNEGKIAHHEHAVAISPDLLSAYVAEKVEEATKDQGGTDWKKLYESAVKGRSDFRKALRESRAKADKYGLALMMIREGAEDPRGVARNALPPSPEAKP